MRGLPSPFQPHCAKVKRTVILATLLCAGISAAAVPLYVVGSESMKPARQQISPPNFDGGYEAVSFGTTSGRTLRGWFLTGTDDVGIVLLHGIRSDRTSLVERAKFLRRQGYNVLLFDLQAHGDSDGDYITFGFIEARDVEAAVKFLRETKKVSRVGIIGLSLGGAAALLADGARADAIILEAVYPTIEAAIGNRLQIKYGSVGKYLTPLLSYQLDFRLGIPAEKLSPIEHLSSIRVPLLFIAGGKDRHTSVEDTRALFARANEPKSLWIIEDAAHQDFYRKAPAQYEKTVLAFLRSAGF
jgi:fermentation-respiration switch protein FrsA (DUF1100 family)